MKKETIGTHGAKPSPNNPMGVSGFPGRGSGGRNHIEIERDYWLKHAPQNTGGVSGFPGRGSQNARELTFQEQFGGKMPHPLPQK